MKKLFGPKGLLSMLLIITFIFACLFPAATVAHVARATLFIAAAYLVYSEFYHELSLFGRWANRKWRARRESTSAPEATEE